MKKSSSKKYPLLPNKTPDRVNEPEGEYKMCFTDSTRSAGAASSRYSKGVTEAAEFTAEEFADLIAEAEGGPFFTLEEMDKDFEVWEKEFLKSHGIVP